VTVDADVQLTLDLVSFDCVAATVVVVVVVVVVAIVLHWWHGVGKDTEF
jgi:hypothetical protein